MWEMVLYLILQRSCGTSLSQRPSKARAATTRPISSEHMAAVPQPPQATTNPSMAVSRYGATFPGVLDVTQLSPFYRLYCKTWYQL